MRHGKYITIAGFVIIVTAFVGWWLSRLPRAQLVDQTTANLGWVLQDYIRARGVMPTGMAELEKAGFVFRTSDGLYSTTTSPHVLYYLECINIAWGRDLATLEVRRGELRDTKSGQICYIIKRKGWWLASTFGSIEGDMQTSIRVFEAFSARSK